MGWGGCCHLPFSLFSLFSSLSEMNICVKVTQEKIPEQKHPSPELRGETQISRCHIRQSLSEDKISLMTRFLPTFLEWTVNIYASLCLSFSAPFFCSIFSSIFRHCVTTQQMHNSSAMFSSKGLQFLRLRLPDQNMQVSLINLKQSRSVIFLYIDLPLTLCDITANSELSTRPINQL